MLIISLLLSQYIEYLKSIWEHTGLVDVFTEGVLLSSIAIILFTATKIHLMQQKGSSTKSLIVLMVKAMSFPVLIVVTVGLGVNLESVLLKVVLFILAPVSSYQVANVLGDKDRGKDQDRFIEIIPIITPIISTIIAAVVREIL